MLKRISGGLLVTLEGPDGAGKSTQAQRLADRLQSAGLDVVVTREPGGTRLGEAVRGLLLGPAGEARDPLTDAFLFNAARHQLVLEVIRPGLNRGAVVICDRFADSTLAYQGYGAGLPIDELRAIQAVATGGLAPDLTILLDVPPEIGLARKSDASRNRFESAFDLAFHERVRAGFLALARAEPGRFRVIDSARHIDLVAPDVIAAGLSVL